jgi:rubrerythrin
MKSNHGNLIKAAVLAAAILLAGCSTRQPDKTIANLKACYTEEISQIDRYYKYALKAKEEKYDKIALMFTALAKSEAIQARNFKKVLDKLGVIFTAPEGNNEAHSTFENLLEAYKSETYDIQVSYPNCIVDAKTENVPDALESFSWAKNDDLAHMGYYFLGLTAYGNKSELTLPGKWYVCPKCGETFAEADVQDPCPICKTQKSEFFEFK